MKNIIKYILIFIITVLLLVSILIGTAYIPREKIAENIIKTKECLNISTAQSSRYIISSKAYTDAHAYADIMLLNIIYYRY